MMEDKSHHLLQPLIPSSTTKNSISAAGNNHHHHHHHLISSNSGIIFRFGLIIIIAIISIWANHEASKGHSITIVNEATSYTTQAGRRFNLFYASNDKASRLVYDTSKFVEIFLYPNASYPKKQINHVILWLNSRNTMPRVVVDSPRDGEYVLYISPSIMDEINHSHAMFLAVQRGVTLIWLWDGKGEAPSSLVNGIVEYISKLAIARRDGTRNFMLVKAQSNCSWQSENPKEVEEFLNYYEMKKPGFIRRLNQELRNGWDDQMVNSSISIN